MRHNGLKRQASVGGHKMHMNLREKSLIPLRYQSVTVKHAVKYIVIT